MLLAVEVTVKQIHTNTNSLVLIWNDGQIRWRLGGSWVKDTTGPLYHSGNVL